MTKRLGIGLALGLLSAQTSWVLAQDQNLRDPLYELYISSTTPEHYKRIIETMLLNPDSDQSGTTSLGPAVYQVLGPGGGAIATAAAAEPSFGLKNIFTYPNPARAGAEPIFHVEAGIADRVNIRVYDVAGREVHNVTLEQAPVIKDMGSGPQYVYEHIWDGPIASGVYFYVVEAEKANEPKISKGGRMAVVR